MLGYSICQYYSCSCGGSVAKVVRRSPPTAGIPSSRLGRSMWVSWWKNRRLGRFLPFSSATNFIPPFLHTHLIRFVSFVPVMIHQAWSAGMLAILRSSIKGFHRISSLDPILCRTRVEHICFYCWFYRLLHGRLARWRACDIGEAKEGLENELWRRWSDGRVGEWTVT